MVLEFRSELWLHSGEAAWHFVTLPIEVAEEVQDASDGARRGFGSVKVRATIGGTTWSTSLFPDSASGSFVLPVKRAVRRAEDLTDGDEVDVTVELVLE